MCVNNNLTEITFETPKTDSGGLLREVGFCSENKLLNPGTILSEAQTVCTKLQFVANMLIRLFQ